MSSPQLQTRQSPPHAPILPYLNVAARIGAQLVRDAIWHGAACNWFGPVFEEHAGSQQLACGTLGPGLYDGTAGIALFLGYLHRATGDSVFARSARGAIEHALSRADDVPDQVKLGFYTGLVGIGYAAIEVGRCLREPGLVERGLELVRSSTLVSPHGKVTIDVMSGNAGVIPVLLRLHAQLGDAWLLEAARSRGEALLARGRTSERGRSWDVVGELAGTMDLSPVSDRLANVRPDDPDRPDLIGLSHGTGGVAWALLELGAALGDARFVAGARAGFTYEDSWFDPALDRWPDLRHADAAAAASTPGPIAWCHGAVGIGLARMRAWELTGDDRYRRDVLSALKIAARAVREDLSGAANYSLCHGLAGNAELFLRWAASTGDREAEQLIYLVAQRGVSEYADRRRPWPSGIQGAPQSPCLMLGIAGTGYFYLRAAQPAQTPSILLVGAKS